MAQVLCETAPELIQQDERLFLVSDLQVLLVFVHVAHTCTLILQVTGDLPDILPHTTTSIKVLAWRCLDHTVKRHLLLGES